MAGRCLCHRIKTMLQGLPWFRQIPAGARWLLVELVERMASPAYDGAIPYSDPHQVSIEVSMDVTETETYLETLIGKGLLARGDGGRLTCPAFDGISARVRASRENGRKGGRPRKEAAPTPATDPRQIAQPLPIPGGLSKPNETQRWETASAGAAPRGLSSSSSSSTSKSETTQVVAREGEWQRLAQQVAATARLTFRRPDWTPARAWLEAGATPELVLRVVEAMIERPNFDASKVNGLGYFSPAIMRALETSQAEPKGDRSTWAHEETDLDRRIRAWEESGHRGPPPRLVRPEHHAA